MKVLLVNGSPHKNGNTKRALDEVKTALEEDGIECSDFWIGNKAIIGCQGCGACRKLGKCVYEDSVNEFNKIAGEYDGYVFGSPVHYAAASGALTSFMDRAFYSGKRSDFFMKPGAAVVSARRGGCTATFDQLNKYFTIMEMPIISSVYWNMVHAAPTPELTVKDEEGMCTMRNLGHNMAYYIKCRDAAEKAGIELPKNEPKKGTSFLQSVYDEYNA